MVMRPDKARRAPTVTVLDATPAQHNAMGGLDGASRTSREMALWQAPIISPDAQINPVKDQADARGLDIIQNDGLSMGAVHSRRDSVVGDQFTLVATPDWELLGASEEWADEFSKVVEGRFNLAAESDECWFDAGGTMTLVDMLRLDVTTDLIAGECVATVEWDRALGRPFSTCIQAVAPLRLSNPDGRFDDQFLRKGVVRNIRGVPQGYWFRVGYPNEFFNPVLFPQWKYVEARKPWGRRQVIHIREPLRPDQTRGIAPMVAALKEMKMTRKFKELTLQQAVVNATYAAAIESDLPSDVVFQSLGAGGQGLGSLLEQYMGAMGAYVAGSKNLAIDGVKMPHLFPGTKLNVKSVGTPGGVGTPFEQSMLRGIAASLGQSYEEFARDFSQTNYSSARASMAFSERHARGKKKSVADRKADAIYTLWAEEMLNAGQLPLPPGFTKDTWYKDPILREALLSCQWIGAAHGQIDEMKETQAAIMRINAGLSTRQKEIASLGGDWRRVFKQLSREKRMALSLNLDFSVDATKPGANDRQETMKEDN